MSDVPDELLREILSRLPVTPLLRFRCVSKSWKDLIDSQQFIQHHLIHSRKTNSNLNILLRSDHQLYSVDSDLLNETNVATFKQLPHPLQTPSAVTKVLGSCDGLLVLRNRQDDLTIFWNPSVKRFHVIPCTSIQISGINVASLYGFGYDVVTDDYKLFRFTLFYEKDVGYNSKVMVYSLKSDSWRRIPDFPYRYHSVPTSEGVLANGALHWIVTGESDDLVVAFDLGTEEYRLVPLPKFAKDENITYLHLEVAVFGGCLSIMCYVNRDYVDLWVMKEYGVEESWSILFSYHNDGVLMQPLAYSKCGRKVLLVYDENVLSWYDLDQKASGIQMVQMPKRDINETYTCLQSLVLLNNSAHDLDLVVKTKQERKNNVGSSRKRPE